MSHLFYHCATPLAIVNDRSLFPLFPDANSNWIQTLDHELIVLPQCYATEYSQCYIFAWALIAAGFELLNLGS
jgi:hypothetical protein